MRQALKALSIRYLPDLDGDYTSLAAGLGESRTQSSKLVGDGTKSSVIMAPMLWLAKQVAKVPLAVMRDMEVVEVPGMLELIHQRVLFEASIDVPLYGNAYIEIVRGGLGAPLRLRYLAFAAVEPIARPDDPDLLSHVVYNRAGQPRREIHVDDLIHVAMGIDPKAPLTGISPFYAMLQDAGTDMESALITATVLRNQAVPGLIMTPNTNGVEFGQFDEEVAKKVQGWLDSRRVGAERGKSFITSLPVTVTELSTEVEKLALQTIRGISEERVTALVGVPAAVCGLGVGLRQTKVGATMRELRGVGWDNGVLPVVDMILEQLNAVLAPEFGDGLKYGYRLPPEHVANQDAIERANYATTLYKEGVMMRSEAREAVNLPVTPEDEQYVTGGAEDDPPPDDPQEQTAPAAPSDEDQDDA